MNGEPFDDLDMPFVRALAGAADRMDAATDWTAVFEDIYRRAADPSSV
jgi:hypothetical protein